MKYVLLAESKGTPEQNKRDSALKDEGKVANDNSEHEIDQDDAEEDEGI